MPKKQRSDWGSVRPGKTKGTYELRYTINGKSKSETIHGTRKDAERRKAELRIKYEDYKDCEMPLGAFWERVFHPECQTRVKHGSMSPTTLYSYEKVYNANIKPEFELTPLNKLTAKDVQKWLYTMTQGAAAHAKTLLKIIMRRAEDLDYVEWHCMNKRYFMPTVQSGTAKSKAMISASEAENMLELIRGNWLEAAYILAIFGGGQRSEILGIKPDEIEFRERPEGLFVACPVNQTVHLIKGDLIIKTSAKNEVREGYIILGPPHSHDLKKLVDESIKNGDKWLFDDGFGSPVFPSALSWAWKKFLHDNKLKHVPFANLRNSYSTNLHTKGLEDSTISKLMRHANLTTDYRNYNKPSADDLIDRILAVK